jgi:hypothetical protein
MRVLLLTLILLSGLQSELQTQAFEASGSFNDPVIYLFPGQGADCRLFNKIQFPFDTIHCELPVPERKTNLREYALQSIERIDTSRPIILMGVSLGGMICTELADTLNPLRVIVISSAKERSELPGKYTFQRYIPLNKLVPRNTLKRGAIRVADRVEPERTRDSVFFQMLSAKDPVYLKRTVNLIINWTRRDCPTDIIHIHGDADATLPLKNVEADYVIDGGTHMMVYILGKEISDLIQRILSE